MKKLHVTQFDNDDEYNSRVKSVRKASAKLRNARKSTRSIDLKRLDESKCKKWREVFNG